MNKNSEQFTSLTTLDQIADQFVSRIRAGEHPSLQEYLDAYPNFSADIEELFPTLAELENYDPLGESNQPAQRTPIDLFKAPSRLGDYLIKREIGRGGMGIVYEAEHATLRRRVALKILPANSKNQNHEKRFLREARAAGQLHHTNIVPIFEVGESNGVNFYAMQYIHGQNLDVVIDQLKQFERNTDVAIHDKTRVASHEDSTFARTLLMNEGDPNSSTLVERGTMQSEESNQSQAKTQASSFSLKESGTSEWSQIGESGDSYYRRVARVGIQIADALEYAHNHGVLHRDIKPSNLILDTDGIVWITDFGLAKDDSDNLTHTGDIVGTLRYMAPERFKGDADVRSEVYSLGLTLYELCTLQHAFDQTDRAQLVQQVTSHEPVPPRKIRPEIPLDLETVIAKAIAREPSRRYSTARQMSADLKRFVSDRPVLARRVSVIEKIYRWARRHPAHAALASCLAFICLLITGGSIYLAKTNNRHAGELKVENLRVLGEQVKTEEALKKAERAVLSSRAHLYYSYLGQADATQASGKQGQNFASLNSVLMAANIVPKLGLSADRVEKRHINLRTAAIAAMAHWDVDSIYRWKQEDGWTTKIAADFQNDRIAQADDQGNIAIRKFGSREAEFELSGPTGEHAWLPVFSPNGKYLVVRYHHPVTQSKPVTILWDVDQCRKVLSLDRPILEIGHCFSSDSSLLAVCRRGNIVEVYSTITGEKHLTFKTPNSPLLMHFARNDSQLILTQRDQETVDFWNLSDTPEIVESIPVASKVTALDWNDRLGQFACAMDHHVFVWPPHDLQGEPVEFAGHLARVVNIELHPTGKVVMSSSWDGTTRFFDLVTRKQVIRIEGRSLPLGGFDQTGCQIAYSSRNDEFGIWKLPDDRPVNSVTFWDKGKGKRSYEFVPGHAKLVTFATQEGIEFWNHGEQKFVGLIPAIGAKQYCFSDDGKQLMTSGDDGIKRWAYDLDKKSKTSAAIEVLESESVMDKPADKIDWLPSKQLLAASFKRHFVELIDLETNESRSIGPHINLAKFLFSPDGRFLVTATWQGSGIKVWDTDSGELVKDLAPNASTASIGVSKTTNTLAIVTGEHRSTWSMDDWSEIASQRRIVPDGWHGDAEFSPNGKTIAVTYSRYLPQLVDAETHKTIAILEAPTRLSVGSLKWSDDGRFLFLASENAIQVWDITQLRERLRELQIDWRD